MGHFSRALRAHFASHYTSFVCFPHGIVGLFLSIFKGIYAIVGSILLLYYTMACYYGMLSAKRNAISI